MLWQKLYKKILKLRELPPKKYSETETIVMTLSCQCSEITFFLDYLERTNGARVPGKGHMLTKRQ